MTDYAQTQTGSDHEGEILIFGEYHANRLHPVTFELIGKARELQKDKAMKISCATMIPSNDEDANAHIEALRKSGVDKVYYILHPDFAYPDVLLYKENLVNIIRRANPAMILIGATLFGRSLAPRVAVSFNTGLTADCTDLNIDAQGALVQIRPAFSEHILAKIITNTLPPIATVRYREFTPADPNGAQRKLSEDLIVEKVDFTEPEKKYEDLRIKGHKKVHTADAPVIVAGGKGLKKGEDFSLLKNLANQLGGTIGASRDAVESGMISKDYQIGYSGTRVKPKLYIACGISGAPQHLAGMQEAETIVAINSDSSAPIFNICDYGIVGDLYDVVPQFMAYLEKTAKVKKSKQKTDDN